MSSKKPPVAAPFGLRYRKGLKLHKPVTATGLSSDGRKPVVEFRDGTGQLWDLEEEVCQPVPRTPLASITTLAFSPDGKTLVSSMDRAADAARDRATAAMVLKGKKAPGDFDVFLSYNGRDKPAVSAIAHDLRERGKGKRSGT
jgi:hypothetical protein